MFVSHTPLPAAFLIQPKSSLFAFFAVFDKPDDLRVRVFISHRACVCVCLCSMYVCFRFKSACADFGVCSLTKKGQTPASQLTATV